jgi:DNA-binding MarR family transcriptional regulator
MHDRDRLALLGVLLGSASKIIDEVHASVVASGATDLRPTHGFAFARISLGDATVSDVAEHLSVTKQAASVLVGELVDAGYVTRTPHPTDARAQVLALTERGWACTQVANEAMIAASRRWERVVGSTAATTAVHALGTLAQGGRLRPI